MPNDFRIDLVERLTSEVAEKIKELRKLKQEDPSLSLGYRLEPGSLLNAYREGDLSFEETVSALDAWRSGRSKSAGLAEPPV